MSRFPSLQNVLNATQKTIFRFPLEIITAITGTVLSIIFNHLEYGDPNKEFYNKAIMSCCLCLVLFLSISLFFTAAKKNQLLRYVTSLVLGGLTTAFIFSFHKRFTEVEIQQFLVLNIAFHLLVSFAGFLPRTYNQDEFWEFNKQLFLRILTAVLYSSVLYLGLALAILAIDELFKIEFYNKVYFDVFLVIAGIFNTIFFLSGVPETNNNEAPLILSYPKGLKNFTQYVLLPLISLYLIILLCYETKILVTLSLPVGWVSYLVLVFAIFGILSFLLVHPIASETKNLWMRTFNRWFYFLLIPLLGLLFWAILYRINLYGFTHERYYVLLLSIWLSVVVVYFLVQKNPKIKFIPISMCIAGLLSIAGPQSADSVSKYSQLSRFETYLKIAESKKLNFKQEKELSSIVSFLEETYGIEVMFPYTGNKLKALAQDEYTSASDIMTALGFDYHSPYDNEREVNKTFSYYNYEGNIVNIHGYDFTFTLRKFEKIECNKCLNIDGRNISIESTVQDYGQDIKINGNTIPLKLNDFVKNNPKFKDIGPKVKDIIQIIESPKYTLEIKYFSASGDIINGQNILNDYDIKVKVAIKK